MERESILIVEDDPQARKVLDSAVTSAGLRSITASSGREGLELLAKHKPVLVLLDLVMPDFDGFDFLREIKASAQSPFDVIVVTGYDTDENIQRGYELGAALIMRKPFILEELRHVVCHFVERRALEASLREANAQVSESKESLSLTLDSINDGVWDYDVPSRKIERSAGWYRMLGYQEGEIASDPESWKSTVHPDDLPAVLGKIHAYLEGQTPTYECEYRCVCKNGSTIWIADRAKIVSRTPEGKPLRVVGAHQDITQRKEAELALADYRQSLELLIDARTRDLEQKIQDHIKTEEELRLSELRYKAAVEDQTEMVARFLPDGTLILVNDAYCRYHGKKRSELIGNHFLPDIPPEDWERVKRCINALSPENHTISIEHRVRLGDGSLRWNQWVHRAFFSKDGRLLNRQCVGRDITELKTAEMELSRSKEFLSEVINFLPAPLFVKDGDLRFIQVNAAYCKAFGVKEELLLKKTSFEVFPPSMAATITKNDLDALQTEDVQSVEECFACLDGVKRTMLTWRIRLQDSSGGHIIIGTSRDITDRKNLENFLKEAKDAAESANKAKSNFLANVSHEIRTPMTGIVGIAGMLLDTKLDASQRSCIESIISAGETLLNTIRDILDFSRIEAGRIQLAMEPVDLKETVMKTIRLIGVKAQEKNLEFKCEFAADCPDAVITDSLRLVQILNNLLGNAVKFTDTGHVRLNVRPLELNEDSCLIEFVVSDTGIGIDEKDISKIFNKFTQVDDSPKRKYGGSGLGLAIVKEFVGLFNGKIWVESKLGDGSDFHLTIPFKLRKAPGKDA